MAGNQAFSWPDGQGWIVLTGGTDGSGAVRSQTLARSTGDGNIAYISFAKDTGDALLDDMEDLGAPTGYMLDIESEDADALEEQLKEVNIIVIEAGDSVDALKNALTGPPLALIRSAFERGVIILLEGEAASVFGHLHIDDDGHLSAGLDWLQPVILFPGVSSLIDSEAARLILAQEKDAVAVGIGVESALALGPDGLIETWGKGEVTISLGTDRNSP